MYGIAARCCVPCPAPPPRRARARRRRRPAAAAINECAGCVHLHVAICIAKAAAASIAISQRASQAHHPSLCMWRRWQPLVQRIYSSQATAAAPAVSFVGWAAASAASPAVVACAALAALVGGSGCSCACDAGVVVDGKVVPVGRNAVMGCGTRCGGLGEMQILEMEEGRAVVDFRAAKGFFQCYHRCVAAHKASKAGAGRLVEESILDVEGIGPGVSPYWVQEHAAELSGRTAVWRVLLAELPAESSADIVVYEGRVTGRIVPLPHGTAAPKRDSGFAMFNRPDDGSEGFEAVFVAEGDSDPLSSCITPVTDARAKARAQRSSMQPCLRVPIDAPELAAQLPVSMAGGGEGGRAVTVATEDPIEAALVQMQRGVPSVG
jgi:hypothetical protein